MSDALDISCYLSPIAAKELTARADHHYAVLTSNRHKSTSDVQPGQLDDILLRLHDKHAFIGYRLEEDAEVLGFAEAHLVVLDGWLMWLTVLSIQDGEFSTYLTLKPSVTARLIDDFLLQHPSENWVMVKCDQIG
jgi:hypothetical protein